MKKSTKINRRLASSYFSTIISISLVLFLSGLMGLLSINAKRLSDYVKENVGITLILNESLKETDVFRLQKKLDAYNYIKSTKYEDKKVAAEELKKELGEDFIDFLGYNPLLSTIDVKLFAEYANEESLKLIEKEIMLNPEIKEFYYQRNLVKELNTNTRKSTLIILILDILLFAIFITLINNTIRLSIYSKRFEINTMQLVGATRSFIRKPFINKSIIHGIYGALVACSLWIIIFFFYQSELKEFIDFQNPTSLTILIISLFLCGIIITGFSTYFAVNKFLRMRFDQLFY